MKNKAKYVLQKLFGFENYLLWFSKFKVATLKWDDNENQFFHFLSLMPNCGVILDVGANIGIMTCWLAKEKPAAQIVSFEPIKENFEALSKIVKSNNYKNVVLKNSALGAKKGFLKMIMPLIGNAKQQGLSHVYNENEQYEYGGEKYTVTVEKIDDVFANEKQTIVGIKMDVENFEYQVLQGAQEILKKHKPLLYVELWDNENRKNCFTLIQELGYKILVLENKKLVPFNNQETQNFFFVYN